MSTQSHPLVGHHNHSLCLGTTKLVILYCLILRGVGSFISQAAGRRSVQYNFLFIEYTEIPAVSIRPEQEQIKKKQNPCSSQKYMCWSTSNLQENYNYLINKHG